MSASVWPRGHFPSPTVQRAASAGDPSPTSPAHSLHHSLLRCCGTLTSENSQIFRPPSHIPPSRSTSSPHHLSLFTLAIDRYPINVDALLRIDRLFRDRHTWLHSLANRYLSERRNNPQVSLEKRSSRKNTTMAAQTLMSILSLAVTPTVISSTL